MRKLKHVCGQIGPWVHPRSQPGRQLAGAIIGLLAAGCGLDEWARNGFKVGPNYTEPTAPVANQWIDYQREAEQAPSQAAELKQWWHVFDDPVLNSLISD